MLHQLTFYEVLKINELLAFQTTSLKKSKLFLETVKGKTNTRLLENDIDLSTQEIKNLRSLLLHTAF
ncbi:hypothetical protein QWY14_02665 [Planococcus sp. N028]|uniref:Uncharacterized protein n=1 Tax=Planococcus shixiaomingii TaxID=3058393 RepID=A0ABT8MYF8_9BACL|nr:MULTISPECIES: hypothetical protein [unclassified Planococcus (in: firmicutes)]MDN7240671.1 hypothetical protein [Planococcus sp. N028]WKA56567.1 hypothetical protein QWY21_09535 [Planococcus sp. N022]